MLHGTIQTGWAGYESLWSLCQVSRCQQNVQGRCMSNYIFLFKECSSCFIFYMLNSSQLFVTRTFCIMKLIPSNRALCHVVYMWYFRWQHCLWPWGNCVSSFHVIHVWDFTVFIVVTTYCGHIYLPVMLVKMCDTNVLDPTRCEHFL